LSMGCFRRYRQHRLGSGWVCPHPPGLTVPPKRTDLGGLPKYMIWKAERKIQKGDLREGIDMLWTAVGLNAPKPEQREETLPYVAEWLRCVGWRGRTVLASKVRLAGSLQAEIQGMAESV